MFTVTPAVSQPDTDSSRRVTGDVNTSGPPSGFLDGTAPAGRHDSRAHEALHYLAAFRALRHGQLEAFLYPDGSLNAPTRRVATSRLLSRLRERGFVQAVTLPGGG